MAQSVTLKTFLETSDKILAAKSFGIALNRKEERDTQLVPLERTLLSEEDVENMGSDLNKTHSDCNRCNWEAAFNPTMTSNDLLRNQGWSSDGCCGGPVLEARETLPLLIYEIIKLGSSASVSPFLNPPFFLLFSSLFPFTI